MRWAPTRRPEAARRSCSAGPAGRPSAAVNGPTAGHRRAAGDARRRPRDPPSIPHLRRLPSALGATSTRWSAAVPRAPALTQSAIFSAITGSWFRPWPASWPPITANAFRPRHRGPKHSGWSSRHVSPRHEENASVQGHADGRVNAVKHGSERRSQSESWHPHLTRHKRRRQCRYAAAVSLPANRRDG